MKWSSRSCLEITYDETQITNEHKITINSDL
jgi:hypothetical protein